MRFDGSVGIVWNPPVISFGISMKDAFCCAMFLVDNFEKVQFQRLSSVD